MILLSSFGRGTILFRWLLRGSSIAHNEEFYVRSANSRAAPMNVRWTFIGAAQSLQVVSLVVAAAQPPLSHPERRLAKGYWIEANIDDAGYNLEDEIDID